MGKKAYIRQAATAKELTEYQLRRMAKEGKVPFIMSGNRYIFDLDLLEDALNKMAMDNMRSLEDEDNKYGVLRKVNAH